MELPTSARLTIGRGPFVPVTAPSPDRHAALLSSLLASVGDFIYAFDRGRRFLYANQALASLWGLTPDQYLGRSFAEIGYPADLCDLLERHIEQVFVTAEPVSDEVRYISPLGVDGFYKYIFYPVFGENGSVNFVAGVTHNVTERRAGEKLLRESERRYQSLFDAMFEGFCVIEQVPLAPGKPIDFRYVAANPNFITHAGVGDVVGRTIRELFPGEPQEWFDTYEDVFRTGNPLRFERELSSQPRTLELFAFPCGEVDRPLVGIAFSDITLRKRASMIEKALQQSEKLAVVGRLTTSIAHEINNPLESLTNLFYLALGDNHLSPETRTYLQTAEGELRRIVQITAQTLRFHRQSKVPVLVSAKDIVGPVLALYEGRLLETGVVVQSRVKEEDTFLCYAGELRQVVVNLVANAFDAMRTGGRLVIRSRRATDWTTGARGMRFTVADTGEGMTPATRARIFEPFFTTKEDTGTGLGLWVSKEIVQKHNGSLRVRSRQAPGPHGTVFTTFVRDEITPIPS